MNSLGLLLPMVLANPPVVPVQPPLNYACVPVQTPNGVKLACPPLGPPAPILATRVLAPAGTLVNFRPGTAAAPVAAPAAAGLRPGYRYVLELSHLPTHPGRKLYPDVEVTGSLVPRASLNVLDFPTPILISQGDIDLALAGAMVTKVVYLEDPTKAVPVDSTPDRPLEFTELTVSDAVTAARESGRPVLIVRIGDRAPEPGDLQRIEIPGTVFLPGEPLAAAASAPVGPCVPVPLYDPILGPRPLPEECITDGGDKGPRLGIGPNGVAGGINPTDVSLEYSLGQKRKVTTSNEVCVCSPRFVTRRVELVPAGVRVRQDLNVAIQETRRGTISNNVPAQEAVALVGLRQVQTRLRPSVVIVTQNVAELVVLTTPKLIYRLQGIAEIKGTQETDEITSGPNEMVVTKAVEPFGAVEPGQVVTFTLRYRNATDKVATDLVLTDSLSGRLEFVAGSPESDRPANVTRVPNAAGSEAVQFEIPGPVPPGGTGVVKFKAKVR